MLSGEDITKVADLLEARYRKDFSRMITVFNEETTDRGMRLWGRYLRRFGIVPLLGTIEYFGMEMPDITAPGIEVQIIWNSGIIGCYFVPEDLALKVLTLGEFPPADEGWGAEPSLN